MLFAAADPLLELLDCLGLVPGRREIALHLEGGDRALQVFNRTHVASLREASDSDLRAQREMARVFGRLIYGLTQ